MFYKCKSLISLPDISIWDASKVKNMELLFSECESLISLPDISKWKVSKDTTDMYEMFKGCLNLLNIPSKFI